MAHLDVRERRMETTIAYVGAKLAGKATNLRHLKSDSAHGRSTDLHIGEDRISLEWRPHHLSLFDACDITVKLVAAKGAPSTEQLDEVLENADGVVVVVDSAPTARDENARILTLVRAALGRGDGRRSIPVVVQANKVDLTDALPVEDLAGAVEWPVVPASAKRGEGVVETIEMALGKVVEAMKTRTATSATAAKMDQNPLLSALRAILRETVSVHMAEIEKQAAERIASSVSATVEGAERLLAEIRTMLLMNAKDTVRAVASQEDALGKLAASVAEMQAVSSALATRVDRLVAAQEKLQEELAARSRADREHVSALASAVKRQVQSLELDVKKLDAREQQAQIVAELAKLESKVEALTTTVAPAAASIVGFPARLGALESAIQRDVRDRVLAQLTRLEGSVHVLHVDTGESMQRADARAGEIQAGLDELLDELKKRKKGWFS